MMDTQQAVILLAEDDPDHAELVVRGLTRPAPNGRIQHVTDGAEALDYLHGRGAYSNADHHPRPALVLLDLRLPKVDGLSVLREIKSTESLRHIPVVVLSTSDAESDVSRAYDLNVNSYLVKPLDFNQFSQMMQELGIYWLGWNHVAW